MEKIIFFYFHLRFLLVFLFRFSQPSLYLYLTDTCTNNRSHRLQADTDVWKCCRPQCVCTFCCRPVVLMSMKRMWYVNTGISLRFWDVSASASHTMPLRQLLFRLSRVRWKRAAWKIQWTFIRPRNELLLRPYNIYDHFKGRYLVQVCDAKRENHSYKRLTKTRQK